MSDSNEKCLILIRGLPGSGKSTFAAAISEKNRYPMFSVDDYFTDQQTGEYHFKFDENHLAYKLCAERTGQAMLKGISKIIVHNTFVFEWELEPYLKLAAEFDYRLFLLTMEKSHNNPNVHGISDEQIRKMAERYLVKLF